MTLRINWTIIVALIGLCNSPLCLSDESTNRAASEVTPLASSQLDSDHDGLPDDVDPDPLIANYTILRWEVTDVRLGYDVKQNISIVDENKRAQTVECSSKGTFSWLVGADGRIEGEVRTKAKVSADPLELFGLRRSGAEISAGIAGSAFVRTQTGRDIDRTEASSMKAFLTITDETAVGNLHFNFSVNIRSFSHLLLSMQLAPIPVLIAGQHVVNANIYEPGASDVIDIPADRPDGVLVSFRANINDTKAFDLVRCLRNGDSPTIDLARSRITIKKKNDPSQVDLVSKITKIEKEDCLLTVRTTGGSVAWRIAPTFGLKPVTLRQAMKAINELLRRETRGGDDFFQFGSAGLKIVAGYKGDGVWLQTDDKGQTIPLDANIPMKIQVSLKERQMPEPYSPPLPELTRNMSYSIGMNIGNSIKRGGVLLDMNVLWGAIRDVLAGGTLKMTDQQAQEAMRSYQVEARRKHEETQKKAAEKNKKEGETFLAENKKREGIKTHAVTLPDGTTAEMQYKVITEGTGATPQGNDTVTVNYRGTLINGKEFDCSAKRGGPAKFQVNRVVRGWTEALQMMKDGSKWQLFIPSQLAYGDAGNSSIEPGSTLLFDVELIGH